MSEEKGSATENQAQENQQEFSPITTQEELDRIIGKRVMREREKFKDYEQFKGAAEELAKIKEANKSDLEKATSRAEKAEEELNALKHEKEINQWVKEVAKETGVPEAALRGETREELMAHAEILKPYFEKSNVYVGSDGKRPEANVSGDDPIRKMFS